MIVRTRSAQLARLTGIFVRDPRQLKHLPRFLQSLGSHPLQARIPWLAFDVIDWIEARTDRGSSVFEYGGGGSTAWFADRAGQVVTAESDSGWADHLQCTLRSATNVEIVQAGPEDGYARYISLIRRFPDNTFDFVLIDGRERVKCVQAAMAKVRSGGYIVLDDSGRREYTGAGESLAGWPARNFRGIAPWKSSPGQSTIWQKPDSMSPLADL